MSTAGHRESLAAKVVNLLERVDTSPITTKQRLNCIRMVSVPVLLGVSEFWNYPSVGLNES